MRCAEHQSDVRCRTGFTAGHPATEWAREEFVGYTEKIFGRVPDVAFFLTGETDDFADDFRALKDTD